MADTPRRRKSSHVPDNGNELGDDSRLIQIRGNGKLKGEVSASDLCLLSTPSREELCVLLITCSSQGGCSPPHLASSSLEARTPISNSIT
ncbi:unnamed protein product [Merluccius merluccius]